MVDPNLEMEDPSETVKLPSRKSNAQILRKGPKRVSIEAHNKVIAELARRAMMDFEEGNGNELVPQEEEEEEEQIHQYTHA